MDDFERDQKLRETIDMKIEKIVLSLGISRSSVHFIENYKVDQIQDEEDERIMAEDQRNSLSINYRALKLLHECTQQAESFLTSNLK